MTKKAPSPRDGEIGRRIRARRVSLGMSQTNLAEGLGLSFQQIQKYEKGLNRIGPGRLEELAQILRVPINFFFDDAVSERGTASALLGLAGTMQSLKLVKAFNSIDDEKTRQAIVDLVVQISSTTE